MTSIYLNGATIMTTPTAASFEIARDAGFAGTEVRTERLPADRPTRSRLLSAPRDRARSGA